MFSSSKDVTQLRIDHRGASWKLLGDDSLFTVTLGALSAGFQVTCCAPGWFCAVRVSQSVQCVRLGVTQHFVASMLAYKSTHFTILKLKDTKLVQ